MRIINVQFTMIRNVRIVAPSSDTVDIIIRSCVRSLEEKRIKNIIRTIIGTDYRSRNNGSGASYHNNTGYADL